MKRTNVDKYSYPIYNFKTNEFYYFHIKEVLKTTYKSDDIDILKRSDDLKLDNDFKDHIDHAVILHDEFIPDNKKLDKLLLDNNDFDSLLG